MLLFFFLLNFCRVWAGDDVIFTPQTWEPVPARVEPAKRLEPEWLMNTSAALAEALNKFFRGMTPDPSGTEKPLVYENPVDYFSKRLGDSGFSFILGGAGTLRYLGGPFYYNQLQGGIGVEYQFIGPEESESKIVLAVRVSPAYGEIAVVRVDAGAHQIDGLPSRFFVGSSFGLALTGKFGVVEPGASFRIRPEIDARSSDGGLAVDGALYMRFRFPLGRRQAAPSIAVTPTLTYYDRGAQLAQIYAWSDSRAKRNVKQLRQFWEAIVSLEIFY